MSKSVAERFQIKKKRKILTNNLKKYNKTKLENHIKYYTKLIDLTTKHRQGLVDYKNLLKLLPAEKNTEDADDNSSVDAYNTDIDTEIDADYTDFADSENDDNATEHENVTHLGLIDLKLLECKLNLDSYRLRDILQVACDKREKMPLSQGCYVGKMRETPPAWTATVPGMLAINKRARIVGERAPQQQQQIYQQQRQQNSSSIKRRSSENIGKHFPNYYRAQQQQQMGTFPATLLYSHSPLQQNQQQLFNTNNNSKPNLQLYYLLGDSTAKCGRLQDAFHIYTIIASELNDGHIPLDRLNTLANCLITYVRQMSNNSSNSRTNENANAMEVDVAAFPPSSEQQNASPALTKSKYTTARWQHAAASCIKGNKRSNMPTTTTASAVLTDAAAILPIEQQQTSTISSSTTTWSDDFDPLLCPLCHDVLRCPVTTNCGHTFCRQCCETITMCNICHIKFPRTTADDFVATEGATRNHLYNSAAPTTATSTTNPASRAATYYGTTTNSSSSGSSFNNANDNQILLQRLTSNSNSNSSNNNANIATIALASSGASSSPAHTAASSSGVRLSRLVGATPTTVTTATVASTTATATTTMASSAAFSSASPTAAAATTAGAVGVVATSSSSSSSLDNMKFMPDVLVRRLVEKWWGADLQAQKISETAASYMHLNLLDDALKFCNKSLEKSPSNFKSLLLRAEVLLKLGHFQSSLADVENALKARHNSAKAHYLRALSLCELGRLDEALYDDCLAICLDRSTNLTNSEIFQHDLTKLLQKLLAQTPKSKSAAYRKFASSAPYSVLAEHRLRRKQIALLSNVNTNSNNTNSNKQLNAFDEDILPWDKSYLDIDAMAMADEEMLSVNAADYMNSCKSSLYTSIAKEDFELSLRRPTSRKHFRRKWLVNETELLPNTPVEEARCIEIFRNVLERAQQEVQRLKKLDTAGESTSKQQIQVPANLIDASDFDCVLCCRTLWKPVVTPCGHTYCWVCLDRCMDYTSSCPLCMSPLVEPTVNQMYQGASSPVPFILAKRPVTKFLEAAMRRFIPENYEKRFQQEMDMEPTVPMFICTTAFPFVPCPLFVYEPRYRLMVRRAVESGEKQFGIVQPHSGKSRYFDVGTILDIRDCVLLGDGCSILSTIGCKRFKILARNEKDGYETAKVEYIHDETITDENVKFVSSMHASVLSKAIDWIESLRTDIKQEILKSFGEMPPVEENWESIADGPAWAWWIIALLPLSQQLKVDILATTSLEKRLRAIEKTIDYMSGNYRRAQQDCSDVVVVSQEQHHPHQYQQQQQEHQHEEDCDNDLHTTDECCQHTTDRSALTNNVSETHATTTEHAQLML